MVMPVGADMDQFKQSQLGKVERRKEEDKKIKKAMYQMKMMIDCQNMETFDKERERVEAKTEKAQTKSSKETATRKPNGKETDMSTEMERMLAKAGRLMGMVI
ncbi:MAG: hypothetical protein HDR71_15215 [Lachnospiraceae bacterium]|nr:hypothetical protein [Lachnospiraceae bacterium]